MYRAPAGKEQDSWRDIGRLGRVAEGNAVDKRGKGGLVTSHARGELVKVNAGAMAFSPTPCSPQFSASKRTKFGTTALLTL